MLDTSINSNAQKHPHTQFPAICTTSKVFLHMLEMMGHFDHAAVKTFIFLTFYFKCIIMNRLWQSWHYLKASSCTQRRYTHKCSLKEITHADASYKHKPTCLKATPVHSFQLCAQPLKCSPTWWEWWATLTTWPPKCLSFSLLTLNATRTGSGKAGII